MQPWSRGRGWRSETPYNWPICGHSSFRGCEQITFNAETAEAAEKKCLRISLRALRALRSSVAFFHRLFRPANAALGGLYFDQSREGRFTMGSLEAVRRVVLSLALVAATWNLEPPIAAQPPAPRSFTVD